MTAIEFRDVTFAYPTGRGRDPRLAVDGLHATIEPASFTLVVGRSGSGKSTVLRAANGLVPHASGGRFSGEVVVGGRSTRTHAPRDLVDVVGFVHQDPEAQFVVDNVEADIAFALENLGMAPPAMRRRVEEVLDALGVAHLRDRDPATLSGGEKQRCAIAGALAAAPGALVLDEPTSQLDPQGADDVVAALVRVNHDLGCTILMAEHRLERVAPFSDDALLLDAGRVANRGAPRVLFRDYPGAPTVTRLGAALAWEPLPLTVRDALAHARAATLDVVPAPVRAPGTRVLVRARDVGVAYDGRVALAGVDVDVFEGAVVAVLGRNGAGKSTLLRALAGLVATGSGTVERSARIGFVGQDPNALLHAASVRDELAVTVKLARSDTGLIDEWLNRLDLLAVADHHPRDLSGGERQRTAVAAVAVGAAEVLVLDEPTRGMDVDARRSLGRAIVEHADGGGAVVIATHDVELAAEVATHVVVIGDGTVIAHGPPRDVLTGSMFAPPLLRVAPPALTLGEVAGIGTAAQGAHP